MPSQVSLALTLKIVKYDEYRNTTLIFFRLG